MCYEVLNRSAAQAYLISQKRADREAAEKIIETAEVPAKKAPPRFRPIDWIGLRKSGVAFVRHRRAYFLGGAGLVVIWMLARSLLDPGLWYHLFGKQLAYRIPAKAPVPYLVSMTQEVKIWSERQGRLDTPLESFQVQEIGSLLLEKATTDKKAVQAVTLRAKEWIQILHDGRKSSSHSIPLNHPSLTEVQATLDKKGNLLERHAPPSPRMGKGLAFILPNFPKGRLQHGQIWTEPIEWVDLYNDWKVNWSGTLFWTLKELEPCAEGTCARLTYKAELRPTLWSEPDWAAKGAKRVEAQLSSGGTALFDTGHGRLLSNTFSYDGLLRIPLKDVGLIPHELRVGRRVAGQAGEVLIHVENKINAENN